MTKPSIFSRDYERKMKRRKRNITLICIVGIFLAIIVFVKVGVSNTDFSDLRNKVQAWVDSGKPEDDDLTNEKEEEEKTKEEPKEEKPKELAYDFTTVNGTAFKAKYQEDGSLKKFQAIEVPEGVTYSINPSMTKAIVMDQNQNILLCMSDGTSKDLTKHTYIDKNGQNYNKDEILTTYPDNIWCSSPKFIDDNIIIYFSNLPYIGGGVKDKYFWLLNSDTGADFMLTGLIGTELSIGNLDPEKGINVSVNGYYYFIKPDGSCVQNDNPHQNSGSDSQNTNTSGSQTQTNQNTTNNQVQKTN